jgi:hemolysin III
LPSDALTTADPLPASAPHYPTRGARTADLVVHVVGLSLAAVGGAVLLALTALFDGRSPGKIVGVAVYAAGVLLMLALSTAYNFTSARRRPFWRRLDRAGIFVMIAGSYTPFTTQVLTGPWAVGMTAAVWAIAAAGALGQVFFPRLDRRIWAVAYLALGWLVVVALKPVVENTAWIALVLLALGGVIYSVGVIFHLNRRLTFARAIWHGHVVAAACAHWAAVLLGVVLAARS